MISPAVWLLLLKTESGDDYEWVFNRRPTDKEVFEIFKRDIPDELGDDPDDPWGSAQYWRIEPQAVEELP